MFEIGSIPWNKGKKYPAPWLKKYRFKTGQKWNHNFAEKFTEEERKKRWGFNKGKPISKAHKLALLQAPNKRNTGKKFSLETRKKMSDAQKLIMTSEHIKKCLRRNGKSKLEIKFEQIINKHNLPYKFVGDGQFILAKKCPDFINTNGKKIAIEVYYRRHKEELRCGVDKWINERTMIFKSYGWKLLFFDETMVNESDVIQAIK